MKHLKLMMVAAMAVLALHTATAKKTVAPRVYMFGFAASFGDTIVHFTDIQAIDSTWMESKNRFLLGRENYSAQLRDHLADKQNMQRRTCIVFYDQKRQRLEKKLQKMRRLYALGRDGKPHYDMRHVDDADFRFQAVDMSDPVVQEPPAATEPQKTDDQQGHAE